MFKFLKNKIQDAISKISKKVEEEKEIVEEPKELEKVPSEKKEIPKEEKKKEEIPSKEEKEKKGFFKKIKEKFEKKEVKEEIPKEEKGIFKKIKEKITTTKISKEKFNELFHELEIALLENNVAMEVVEKIKQDLKVDLVDVPLKKGDVKNHVIESLKKSIKEILSLTEINLVKKVKECKERPCVLLFLGYNGTGKSLTAAKVALYLKNKGLNPLLAAGDTFRAAGAIQLEEYGKAVNVPVIKTQDQGDSCALIYDAIASAKAKHFDAVLADTAGRMHSNADLMDELKKIVRVNKPDLKILILDALSGSDIVEQAKEFEKGIGLDALIITKVDAYEKGGSILSAAYILKKPILFFGCGQKMDSLKEYDAEETLKNLGL